LEKSEVNGLLSHISTVFSDILAERGLLESKLFPVNEYISVACYHTYDYQFDLMKQVWDKVSPENLAKQSKTLLSEVHALSITYQWLYYGLGRMGKIFNKHDNDPMKEPVEKQDEWKWILENWYRLATSYYNTGKPTVAASGGVNLAFGEDTVEWLKYNLQPVGEAQVRKMRRSLGSVELYAFLDECEARAKLLDHGPYPYSDDEILVVSEFTRMYDGKEEPWMPWSNTEAVLPTSTLGVAMTIKGVEATFNDIGTMTIEPGDYSNRVTSACAFAKRGGKVVPIGLDELAAYEEAANAAQTELYMKFAEWDKRKLMLAGAAAYWRGFLRFTDRVGVSDKIDWGIAPHIENEHVPFFMDVDADPAFLRFGRFDDEIEEDPTLYLLPE
jgi:hypothetical protein